jgi:ankyrin repeat protein
MHDRPVARIGSQVDEHGEPPDPSCWRLQFHLDAWKDFIAVELDEIVRVLVGHYPGSILERDADGQLPLHLACTDIDTSFDNPILREVIQFLVDASPESCREKNAHGRLPMHCALMITMPFRSAIECLFEAYPPALQEPDLAGMIPLHHAIAYSLDSEYDVQYLVERCPESLHVQDKRGRLPLHHINEDTHLEVVEFLVEQYPESLGVPDDDGHLPLHRAAFCCYQDGPRVLKYLVERAPLSARVKAKDGSIPLNLAVHPGGCLENVQCLVQGWRESLQETNSNGLTPLLHAANVDSSLDFIYYLATQDVEAFRRRSVAPETPAAAT